MSSLPIPLDRHAPSPSRLLGEKVGSSGFHIWLHFLSTPSFSLRASESVGQQSQFPHTCAEHPHPLRFILPPPLTGQSHCSKLRGADGKYFLQPRSQSILHQLKCCWEEAGRFFFVVVVVWAFALMIRSWCGFLSFLSSFKFLMSC